MNYINRLRHSIKKAMHNCFDHQEQRTITFVNTDPRAFQNPLSIYGPIGSYWLMLWHCKVCDAYSGKMYDTLGGHGVSPEYAKERWLEEEAEVRS